MLQQIGFLNYNEINNRHRHALRIVEGPYFFNNFNAGRWRFTLTPAHHIPLFTGELNLQNRPTMSVNTSTVFSELLREALQSVFDDTRNPNLLIHIYIRVDGVDQEFASNPGVHLGITLGEYLEDIDDFRNRNRFNNLLHPIDRIMEQFAAIVQSNQGAVLNNNTVITIYTYDVPRPGGAPKTTKYFTQEDLVTRAACIYKINNTIDNMCFTRSLILGLAYQEDSRRLFPTLKKNDKKLVERCHRLLDDLNILWNSRIGLDDIERFSKHLNIYIHVYDISDGHNPRFLIHANPNEGHESTAKHVFLLYVNEHYHLITEIDTLLRIFARCQYACFCYSCFRKMDRRYNHRCDTVGNQKIKKLFQIGSYKLAHCPCPRAVELKETAYVERTQPGNMNEQRRVFYLDFETFVAGYYRNCPSRPEPLVTEIPERSSDYSVPYPFIERELDTSLYRYVQQVNHCEIQNEDGTLVERFGTIEEVMTALMDKRFEKSIVMAHFGSSFDFQFMLRYFYEKHVLKMTEVDAPLMRGNKIIKASIYNGIDLLDSYCFVSQPLANFPKIFGLDELKKGYFPHLFNLPHNWGYVGPMPHWKYYEPDHMKPSKRDDFFKWYNQCLAERKQFNFRQEMVDYCHSDVTLLREGMQKFRTIFTTLKTSEGMDISTDPFDYVSIAGVAFDGIYRKYFLPDNEITIVPRPTAEINNSNKSQWIQRYIDEGENVKTVDEHGLQFRFNFGLNAYYYVDGYCKETNTVFCFWNCFYNGCNVCYDSNMRTPHMFDTYVKDGVERTRAVKFGELYANTISKIDKFVSRGYMVEDIWECQFSKFLKKHRLEFNIDLRYLDPLIPRDAYFGGRVNCVKMYYRCDGDEKIYYMDVTSMYPAVMSGSQYYYPVGCPKVVRPRIDGYHIPLGELFGVMKCRVIPPRHLYHPVLPTRSKDGKKVIFDLTPCVGTWTHMELEEAVAQGYVIADIFEQHHFERRLNNLFKDYNEIFFDIKKKAKADGNKGLETIAKLCINGPTGKWGYNPMKSKSNYIVRELHEMLRFIAGRYDQVGVNFLNDSTALVSVSDNNIMTEHYKSNVYISAFITAYSRMKLYLDALKPLGDKVLYFDTDSVMYVSPDGSPLIPIDTTGALGLWTSECPEDDYFYEYVSSGPKCYSLRSRSGTNDIAKVKGCFLHYQNERIFNFDQLKEAVLCKAFGLDFAPIVLHKDERIMRKKYFEVLVEENKGKVLWFNYDKRSIVKPTDSFETVKCVDTLPFNHESLITMLT